MKVCEGVKMPQHTLSRVSSKSDYSWCEITSLLKVAFPQLRAKIKAQYLERSKHSLTSPV